MAENEEQPQSTFDLVNELGSEGGVSTQSFCVYIPNKDRKGKEIGNQRKWILEAIHLLSQINGGATAMPPVEGGWVNDDNVIIWENPVVVYSFIRPDQFLQKLPKYENSCTEWVVKLTKVRLHLNLMENSIECGSSTDPAKEQSHDKKNSQYRSLVQAPDKHGRRLASNRN